MRKILFAIAAVMLLSAALSAQDAPANPAPKLLLDEIVRPLVKTLATPQEDAEYFGGKTSRDAREYAVLIKQFRMSQESSTEDMTVAYRLTVRSSDGQCYGYCEEPEPSAQNGTPSSPISEFTFSEIHILTLNLTTLEEETEFFSGEENRPAREILVRAYGSLETIRKFSQNASEPAKVVVYMFRVYTSTGECYGECDLETAEDQLPLKNEA